jgi:carbon-monoxide dehydrogenase medium subunit
MFPADFGYVRAESLPHALTLLAEALAEDEDAKLLAGGQSLLPMMKLRLATPGTLVDIGGLEAFKCVTADAAKTSVGALTTYRALQHHPLITARYAGVADALAVLADQQVRARGTIGGCVAHGDPASDLPAVLLALDAEVTIASPTGTRTMPIDGFLKGIFSTDLADDEIITAITLPAAPPPGQAYEKFEQPASHLPLAGVCAVAELKEGVITSASVAVTGVAGRVFRAVDTERAVVSHPPHPAVLDAAAARAGSGVQPLSDQHASGPFRLHLAEVLTRRALERAIDRAKARGDAPGRSEGSRS